MPGKHALLGLPLVALVALGLLEGCFLDGSCASDCSNCGTPVKENRIASGRYVSTAEKKNASDGSDAGAGEAAKTIVVDRDAGTVTVTAVDDRGRPVVDSFRIGSRRVESRYRY